MWVYHFDAAGPQSWRISGLNNAKLRPLRRSRSFKVTVLTNHQSKARRDFLLVKNTNLCRIMHRFQVIVD